MSIGTTEKNTFIEGLVSDLTNQDTTTAQADGIRNFAELIIDRLETLIKSGQVTIDNTQTVGTQTVNIQ